MSKERLSGENKNETKTAWDEMGENADLERKYEGVADKIEGMNVENLSEDDCEFLSELAYSYVTDKFGDKIDQSKLDEYANKIEIITDSEKFKYRSWHSYERSNTGYAARAFTIGNSYQYESDGRETGDIDVIAFKFNNAKDLLAYIISSEISSQAEKPGDWNRDIVNNNLMMDAGSRMYTKRALETLGFDNTDISFCTRRNNDSTNSEKIGNFMEQCMESAEKVIGRDKMEEAYFNGGLESAMDEAMGDGKYQEFVNTMDSALMEYTDKPLFAQLLRRKKEDKIDDSGIKAFFGE